MRRSAGSLPPSVPTLSPPSWRATGKMTMSTSWWNIRLRWHCQSWSIVSRGYPLGVSDNCILRVLSGTTRVCSGHTAILPRPAVVPRCPSFVSTLKTNEKPCERVALNAFYLRPEETGFYGILDKKWSHRLQAVELSQRVRRPQKRRMPHAAHGMATMHGVIWYSNAPCPQHSSLSHHV